jgi:hypothetical protein
MKRVFNVPRVAAQDFGNDDPRLPEKLAWISISEPGKPDTIVTNRILDKCPTLKVNFLDLHESIGDVLHPPSKEDAITLVDFLVQHTDKHIIVNCAMGISRSGAVAQFCQDFLGYRWPDFYKAAAIPNKVLYRLMVEYYQEKQLTNNE